MISDLRHTLGTTGGTPLHGLLQTDAPIAAGHLGRRRWSTPRARDRHRHRVRRRRIRRGDPVRLRHPHRPRPPRGAASSSRRARPAHGWLGIEGTDLSDDDAAAMGSTAGPRSASVDRGSPADRAGLDERRRHHRGRRPARRVDARPGGGDARARARRRGRGRLLARRRAPARRTVRRRRTTAPERQRAASRRRCVGTAETRATTPIDRATSTAAVPPGRALGGAGG